MLKSLMIQNFAIIDQIQFDIEPGMSVLTGETGAGKSIIIDAISLLMGARATSFMVKSNTKKALIEGVFDIENHPKLQEILSNKGFDIEDEVVISREISSEGKSQARINYRVVPVALLKEIGDYLADIHSQFETQYLLNDKIHLSLLDQYIGSDLTNLMSEYQIMYKDYKQARKKYEEVLNAPSEEEQLDFYQSKIDEINSADLHEGDIEQLENEKKRMSQFEKIHEKLSNVLYLFQHDNGINDRLYESNRLLSSVDDPELENLQNKMNDSYYAISELVDEIESYKDDLIFDEYRYEEIQNRLFLIKKLQRQYGYEEIDILKKRDEFLEKIELIQNKEVLLIKLEKEMNQLKDKCIKLASKISVLRKEKAITLEKEIISQLNDLYMNNTQFKCEFFSLQDLSSNGLDDMKFLISTNVGQNLHALSDVASGGELSRLMLGMKCIFTRLAGVKTVIFDEVDTGVSGKVAFAIGRKMKEISKNAQVLCITHLPQVASFASNHLFVYKKLENDQTKTDVRWLNDNDRVQEIAKMLSNDIVNESALENAKYLISENSKI